MEMEINQKVRTNLKKLLNNQKETSIAAAVSGGIDSVTLLNILLELKNIFDLKLSVCYVNHNLRGEESDAEDKFVTDLINDLKLPFYKHVIEPDFWKTLKRESTEMAARRIRYSFFKKVSLENNIDFIATAHNFNDKIETFMLQVLRSGGIETLSSIPLKNKNIIRPLLNVTRAEIEEYAKIKNIKHIEDSTNETNIFKRNIIRHKIIPIFEEIQPNYQKTLSRFFDNISSDNKILLQTIKLYLKKMCIYKSQTYFCISKNKFTKLSSGLKRNIIKYILKKIDFPAKPDRFLFKELLSKKEKIVYRKSDLFCYGSGEHFWFVNKKLVTGLKDEIIIEKIPFFYNKNDLKFEIKKIEKSNPKKTFSFIYEESFFPLKIRLLKENDRIKTSTDIKIVKILKNIKLPELLFKEVLVIETKDKQIIGFILDKIFRVSKDFYVDRDSQKKEISFFHN
jgi:tRNA(Ile)-lysidine synthase